MALMLLAASIFLGLLSIFNKVFLFFGKKSGWISGMLIGLLSGFYFWSIDLKILAIAELGFFIVMFYGYVRRKHPSKEKILHINIVMSVLTLLLCVLFFTGYLTLLQAVSSLSFIWGGFLLSTIHKSLGWLVFVLAHAATSYASFYENQLIFTGLQMMSAFVCLYAFMCSLALQKGSDFIS